MTTLLTLFVSFLLMGVLFTAFMMNPVLTIMAIAAIIIVMMFPIQVLVVFGIIAALVFVVLRS